MPISLNIDTYAPDAKALNHTLKGTYNRFVQKNRLHVTLLYGWLCPPERVALEKRNGGSHRPDWVLSGAGILSLSSLNFALLFVKKGAES